MTDFTGRPTAAAPIWPYPHRTVAQVDARERALLVAKIGNRRFRARAQIAARPQKIDLATAPSSMEMQFSRASVLREPKDSG